ncbi:MAG: glycoside hydrolase family 15 protein [Nitrospiraceae bacterium]
MLAQPVTPCSEIADYAITGDARTACLISKQGSIDWLCLPRFDGPSLFNRLLDHSRGGHFTIRPKGDVSTIRRWYVESTAILVTEYQTPNGTICLTDCVPALSQEKKNTRLLPSWCLLRRIEGIEGCVEVEILFKPRPDDGRTIPPFHVRGAAGYFSDLGDRLLHVMTAVPLTIGMGEITGTVMLQAGQQVAVWFAYSEDAPAVYPPLGFEETAIEDTSAYWKGWAARCGYQGPYRAAVIRSALTLRLLTFAPSGAIVAAPTTSLPETIGGTRNWDYRYCWLRDASSTASVFFRLGYRDEAAAFIHWLLHSTTLTYPAFQIVYDVYGQARLPQRELPWMSGYRGSQPVRIGNQAYGQTQLDVYGEVLDSVLLYVEAGHDLDHEMRRRLLAIAQLVMHQWRSPDHGFWEIPNGPHHYVHSKVMCWVALDRAERIARKLGIRADLTAWQQARESIRRTVSTTGYSSTLESFVQRLAGHDIDATALLFPLVGFIEPADPRVSTTIGAIYKHLMQGDLVYRYRMDDGLPGEEGAFLACSFWLVEALVSAGRRDEAAALFEQLQTRSNDVGLYSEEMDPSGRMLGNFPQALTHLAHIGAALRLADVKRES